MAGRVGGEFQPLHNRLDQLSFEWRTIPVLPAAIKGYRDILNNPTNYFFEVEDGSSNDLDRVDLEHILNLDEVTFLYDLSFLQTPTRHEQSEDFFSVSFPSSHLRSILALESLSEEGPYLSIECAPKTIDGMLDQVEKGVHIADFLTDGIPELKGVVEDFFVKFAKRPRIYSLTPIRTSKGLQLSLDSSVDRTSQMEDGDDIRAVDSMSPYIATLSPGNLRKIKIVDISLREGGLHNKKP